jgi:threonyl-tRNA synthetase
VLIPRSTFFALLAIPDINLYVNDQASSSYWRGKADRESLQRVYGISFPDSKRLKVCHIHSF